MFGKVLCVKALWKWIEIETSMSDQDTERDRILENTTLCAMSESRIDVLRILPRLSNTNIESMLRVLGDTNLLFTSIRWAYGQSPVAEFFLRTYAFDLSVRDATGANALALAAKRDMAKVARLILEEREDLLNSRDNLGRTPLSWAAEESEDSVKMLLSYDDIQPELVDDKGLAPIDYVFDWAMFKNGKYDMLVKMLPPDRGINWLGNHGCTLLHFIIDTSHAPTLNRRVVTREHWDKLEHYEGRKIFECREEWEHAEDKRPNDFGSNFHGPNESYRGQYDVSAFRRFLIDAHVSAAQVLHSPCRCGIGTIFLAISTERVEVVEVLLELFPNLVNDKFYDGSSPLDLASCIRNHDRRQSMIDLILNKSSSNT